MPPKKPKFVVVAGARPNFVKIAPVLRELRKSGDLDCLLVHSGQHYDFRMSDVFFRQLGIQEPDINLEVGSGNIAFQISETIRRFDPVLVEEAPDLVLVVGDVNATLAAALTAAHRQIPIAHVEAGLRSFDRSMPEEVNRVMTDAVSSIFFATEPSAVRNLLREGAAESDIYLVGNVMIDTLLTFLPAARSGGALRRLGLYSNGSAARPYGLVTLHRAGNVDSESTLKQLLDVLAEISEELPLIFPVHPRTQERIRALGMWERNGMGCGAGSGLVLCDPMGYLEFLELMQGAKLVLTDSGGIQEETTALQVPCLTLRNSTERPITIDQGSNTLVGCDPAEIRRHALAIASGRGKKGRVPELWDGKAAQRIAAILRDRFIR
jgi:UDP-N-acetylglucosamine 2-epimerase (non-hydrolysing)